MSRIVLLLLLSAVAATPGIAQVEPVAPDQADRRRVVEFQTGETVSVRGAVGVQTMVELSPDEQVRNVAIGESGAWQVDISKDGSRLFLKPIRSDVRTNMTVLTSIRTYSFELEAVPAPAWDTPYSIVFRYAPTPSALPTPEYVDVSAALRRTSEYRISGDRSIRPKSVSDDGRHTYITWPRNVPIPAVHAVDGSGKEVLIDGMMGTDDVYVVASVPRQLVFRIDRAVARAERISGRSR